MSVGFYCVADEPYFPGAVGLVNSLRLVGHTEPIHLLDCGLTARQRDLLAPEVKLIDGPADIPPWLLKTVAPLQHPSEIMVMLDADLVVTRRLNEMTAQAGEGSLVAFHNPEDRFVAEWGELIGLGTARPRRYLSSAAIAIDRSLSRRVLGLMEDLQGVVDFELTHWRQDVPDYAFAFADQDVFNAILATVVPSESVVELDSRLAPTPPFTGLRLLDERRLRCAYEDAVEPLLVHHHVVKPWLEPTHHGIYSRLLRRLLIGDDLAVRVPEREVPPHLRRGIGAFARRARTNARERVRWHVVEPVRGRLKGGTD